MAQERRLLIVNQVVGPLMVDLIEQLQADGWRCCVFTGELQYGATLPETVQVRKGVRLRKTPTVGRIWTWGAFTVQAAMEIVRRRRVPSLVVTNPPVTMLLLPLLKRLLGVRYCLLIYDVYPDAAERLGIIRPGGRLSRLWRRLSGTSMSEALKVFTIGPAIAENLLRHCMHGSLDIKVIPPWVDTRLMQPVPADRNAFVKQHHLFGKFIVMYSGAFGATHGLETLVEAADLLQDLPDVCFVLIGGGTCHARLQQLATQRKLANLIMLDYQSIEMYPSALAAADCAVVALDEQAIGVSVPSKLYQAMAVGAAIIALAPPGSEPARAVSEHNCGLIVPPGNAAVLAKQLRLVHRERQLLTLWKKNSREAAVSLYDKARLLQQLTSELTSATAS